MICFSEYACMNAPVISMVNTSRISCASMDDVIKILSVATVGDAASYFSNFPRFPRPSAHALPLILPSNFSFRNINHVIASLFSSFLKFEPSTGVNVLM